MYESAGGRRYGGVGSNCLLSNGAPI